MNNQNSSFSYLLPLAILILLLTIISKEITNQGTTLNTGNVNMPIPSFSLPNLWVPTAELTQRDLMTGHVMLLHVWGSWCGACRHEHEMLTKIADDYHIPIFSIDYKDDPEAARTWLREQGNPYVATAVDTTGSVSRGLGVHGTPDTFIIDNHGIIRYRHVGTIDIDTWNEILFPLITQYKNAG